MFFKCIILLFFSAFIEAQYPYHYQYASSCRTPHLDHGRVRVRQKAKLVKFMCLSRYELVGNRYATCRNGQWDVPLPVCVKSGPGCKDLPIPPNAVQVKAHHDAWVVTFCLPGYKLVGSPAIYCNGFKWNATSPTCIVSSAETSLSCDFEEPDICGWEQDDLHEFDWTRINKKTPSSFMNTGPTYDHTLGIGKSGYYMYIESTSRLINDTARLLSPIFDTHLAVDGCFSFFYHMYGRGIGGLRVYQKPDRVQLHEMLNMTMSDKQQYILFEQWGDQGDFWYSAAPQLTDFKDSFQIVIEGIRGTSFTSDIAIDDVAVLQGVNCTNFRAVATSPAPIPYSESCEGRCSPDATPGCECSPACFMGAIPSCCADFMEVCIFGNSTDTTDPDDASSSDELPQTDKLIGVNTSTSPTVHPTENTHDQTVLTTLPTDIQPKIPTTIIPTSTKPLTTTELPTTTKPTTTTKLPTTTKPTATTKPPTSTTPVSTTTTPTVPTIPSSTTKSTTTTEPSTNSNKAVTPRKATTENLLPAAKTQTKPGDSEGKKHEKEIDMQKMEGNEPEEKRSSPWKTAIITIVVLSVFASLVYLGIASRTSRGRVALARLRSRVNTTQSSEVRYLNSTDDDL